MAPATKRLGRSLSQVARHVVVPEGIESTGWPEVRDTCERLGWKFDAWQDGAGKLILGKRADGGYAADTIVISIPRQVGKTFLVACIIFGLCLTRKNLTVIWTAHRKTTALETFAQFDGMAQTPKVGAHIRQIFRGKGDEKIVFRNGSRILFGARESGFGRGFTGVDVLVCDEGQIMSESVLEDMAATQNVAPNPLFFMMGTPPRPRDPSETFLLFRDEALSGESEGTLYIETSADRGADPLDRAQWRKANPSFPHRTTERALLRLRKKLKNDDSWNREALGIYDVKVAGERAINRRLWAAAGLSQVPEVWPLAALGLDMHPVTGRLYVAPAAFGPEPHVHVELLDADILNGGVDAAVSWIFERVGRRLPVVLPADSSATVLQAALTARRVKVYPLNLPEQAQASAAFERALSDQSLSHFVDPLLDQAVEEATRHRSGRGEGLWRFGRLGELAGSPLWAVAAAHFGAVKWGKRHELEDVTTSRGGRASSGSGRKVVGR